MVERSVPWPAGTPNWVDLVVDDTAAAAKFYSALFDWDCEDQGEQTGHYSLCRLRGKAVAGLGPKQPGTEQLPSRWTTYLATAHLDRTLASAAANGGQALMEPLDVNTLGRMSIIADPTGATFGLWQAGEHIGAERTAEPGTLVWSEVMSRDYEASKAFYTAVFGYRLEEIGGDDFQYAALYVDDRPVAGTGELSPAMPAQMPAHWLPYFAAASTDDTVSRLLELGGEVLSEPMDTDFGRMAVVADLEGALFAIIQPAEPE
jgi:predicted enzyme related to lactoylglutathione lyase